MDYKTWRYAFGPFCTLIQEICLTCCCLLIIVCCLYVCGKHWSESPLEAMEKLAESRSCLCCSGVYLWGKVWCPPDNPVLGTTPLPQWCNRFMNGLKRRTCEGIVVCWRGMVGPPVGRGIVEQCGYTVATCCVGYKGNVAAGWSVNDVMRMFVERPKGSSVVFGRACLLRRITTVLSTTWGGGDGTALHCSEKLRQAGEDCCDDSTVRSSTLVDRGLCVSELELEWTPLDVSLWLGGEPPELSESERGVSSSWGIPESARRRHRGVVVTGCNVSPECNPTAWYKVFWATDWDSHLSLSVCAQHEIILTW